MTINYTSDPDIWRMESCIAKRNANADERLPTRLCAWCVLLRENYMRRSRCAGPDFTKLREAA